MPKHRRCSPSSTRSAQAGAAIRELGMRFNAGHALNYYNVQPVARLAGIRELHIGHAIVSRAVFVGLREAVREMKQLMREAAERWRMIYGIGTDIVAVASALQGMWERHGDRALEKLLAPQERGDFARAADQGRFLAKRFAAKEAFSKALGTGVRPPATLPRFAIVHDELGKPSFDFCGRSGCTCSKNAGLTAHLSISDEAEYALAFVVLERA